jgi:hypothetical protein
VSVKLNTASEKHAKSLISSGKVDKSSAWAISADEENAMLGDPPNWDGFASWFLGTDDSAKPETKARYNYPFGKSGKVFRRAVIAIKSRAAQQGATSIAEAAARLLDQIDGTSANAVRSIAVTFEDLDRGYAFAAIDLLQSPTIEGQPIKPAQLFHWGINVRVDGRPPIVIDEAFAAQMESNFANRKVDLPIDYNHASLTDFHDAPAAGWITALQIDRPEAVALASKPESMAGVWLQPEWTPEGLRRIRDREYRYMSAVIRRDRSTGEVLPEILGAGLTNSPAIHGLQAVAASANLLASSEEDESAEDGAEREGNMDVLKELGYASVEEVKTALSELTGLREKAAKAEPLSAQLAEANKRVETAEASLKAFKVESAMFRAEALGRIPFESEKLTAEQKQARAFARQLAETSEPLFKEWLASAPPTPLAPAGRLALSLSPADEDDREAVVKKVTAYAQEHKCSLGEAYEALGAAAAKSN